MPVGHAIIVGAGPAGSSLGFMLARLSPNGGQGINMALRDAVVTANWLGPVLARGASAAELDAAAAAVMKERLPEIADIQQYQRKQTQAFLGADGFKSRIGMRLLPFLAKSGLLRALIGRRLQHLQHGTVKIRLKF